MVLSAAEALKAFHSSPERLLCVGSFKLFEKSSFSSRLKSISKLVWPLGGFHTDLRLRDGFPLKFSDASVPKYHLPRILREKSSKYFLSSVSKFSIECYTRKTWTGTSVNRYVT